MRQQVQARLFVGSCSLLAKSTASYNFENKASPTLRIKHQNENTGHAPADQCRHGQEAGVRGEDEDESDGEVMVNGVRMSRYEVLDKTTNQRQRIKQNSACISISRHTSAHVSM